MKKDLAAVATSQVNDVLPNSDSGGFVQPSPQVLVFIILVVVVGMAEFAALTLALRTFTSSALCDATSIKSKHQQTV